MSTMTDDAGQQANSTLSGNAELVEMPRCTRCKLTYLPSKSTSALRLTYCSFLCELGDLGFSMTGLEHMELKKKDDLPPEAPADTEPVAVD